MKNREDLNLRFEQILLDHEFKFKEEYLREESDWFKNLSIKKISKTIPIFERYVNIDLLTQIFVQSRKVNEEYRHKVQKLTMNYHS